MTYGESKVMTGPTKLACLILAALFLSGPVFADTKKAAGAKTDKSNTEEFKRQTVEPEKQWNSKVKPLLDQALKSAGCDKACGKKVNDELDSFGNAIGRVVKCDLKDETTVRTNVDGFIKRKLAESNDKSSSRKALVTWTVLCKRTNFADVTMGQIAFTPN